MWSTVLKQEILQSTKHRTILAKLLGQHGVHLQVRLEKQRILVCMRCPVAVALHSLMVLRKLCAGSGLRRLGNITTMPAPLLLLL